ncbi:MAG TPA: asparagine synthase (glutamine-hydrolyzing) [Phycisphaerales bacterium]|nr:asparagine synthase (glutamine-hydrolyzing) [Phycisphaerales bacterium]
MCGILGVATTRRERLSISDRDVCRLRDLMAHRGPDGAGMWRSGNVALAHRRLAVVGLGDPGRQPMATPDGRYVLVYNGELYNEPDLRSRLTREGRPPTTPCDTETLLLWLATRGVDGLRDLRGMYALALLDTIEHRLTLARDPLGIKPLYWWKGRDEGADLLLFASEPGPILAHPAVAPRPDMAGVSAYLTTIRTTLGDRTLFEGVRALPPGRVMTFGLAGAELRSQTFDLAVGTADVHPEHAARVEEARAQVYASVAAHLRADVPTCCLLSGGLDSAVVVSVAAGLRPGLRTYCAGASGDIPGGAPSEDLRFARGAAAAFGTRHAEAHVDEPLFLARWREMVARLGTPLSTPNEVAIGELARRLRAEGNVVALSGEGADELFGGYDQPLRLAAAHVALGDADPAAFQLAIGSWCPVESKPGLLTDAAWAAAGGDGWLRSWYTDEFARTARSSGAAAPDARLADHLRFQRRVNLAGLLQRLDSALMLESVEGRTPFADVAVAAFAESLPMSDRFVPPDRTKLILREAFAGALPPEIVSRPKASFPLPFERWVRGAGEWIGGSAWLRELVRPEAIELLALRPESCWRLAWPLANLALWADRWWPDAQARGQSLLEEIACGGPSPTVSTQ